MVDSKQQWKGWLFLLPALVLLAIFTVYPMFNTVRIAFLENYSPLDAQNGVKFSFGIKNFITVLSYGGDSKKTIIDSIIETLNGNGGQMGLVGCLTNTIVLTVLTVPLSCFLALLVSVFLNSIPKCSKLFQTIYFLPYVTNSIAIGMVFAMMFNIVGLTPAHESMGPDTKVYLVNGVLKYAQSWGIVNNLLQAIGLNPINWINSGSSYWANIAVMVVYIVWNALPFKILILLGGLQSVNKQYYDAAKIDATPKTRVFFRITVPLLSPMIAYTVITSFIGGFKEYSSIIGIFNDTMGPAGQKNRLNTMVGFIYDAISGDNYGTASAAALILFGIIMIVTLINLFVSKKKVHY